MPKQDSYDRILDKIDAIQSRLEDMEHKLLCMLADTEKLIEKKTTKKAWKKAVDMPIGTKILWGEVEAEVVAYSKYGDEVVIVENMDGVEWVNVNDVEALP